MTTKHTPGPWEVMKMSPRHEGDNRMIIVRAVNSPIHSDLAVIGFDGQPINEANARLIAKAPEMYELMRTMLVEENDMIGISDTSIAKMKAILAAIEGE